LWQTIVHVHLQTMHRHPDSLIARKCGQPAAVAAAARAGAVLASGPPESDEYQDALADLDFWLRSDGHRRNPGTTADLIAAGLFAALRDGIIKAPFRWA
jgi:triphosphoribosyl-dephospho-CoA synthase